jgi:hypothetical protein
MAKNTFKLNGTSKSNQSNMKKHKEPPKKPVKPVRERNEFEAKLLALKERNTKQNNAQKAIQKPFIIAKPIFTVPGPEAVVDSSFKAIDDLLPSEIKQKVVATSVDGANSNMFATLKDVDPAENNFKINIKPSSFSLPTRVGAM